MSEKDTADGGGGADADLETLRFLKRFNLAWLLKLKPLANNPKAWIISTLTALSTYQAIERLEDETATEILSEILVEEYIFRTVLLPAAVAIYDSGVAVIDALLLIFFGGDNAIGIEEGTQVGLLDIPFVVTSPITGTINEISIDVIGGINQFNDLAAETLEPYGIAAPVVVAALWTLEVAGSAWGLWILVNILDPGIIVPTTQALLRPFRNATDLLFGD